MEFLINPSFQSPTESKAMTIYLGEKCYDACDETTVMYTLM